MWADISMKYVATYVETSTGYRYPGYLWLTGPRGRDQHTLTNDMVDKLLWRRSNCVGGRWNVFCDDGMSDGV